MRNLYVEVLTNSFWHSIDDSATSLAGAGATLSGALCDFSVLHGNALITEAVFLLIVAWERITKDLILAEGVPTVISLTNSEVD